MITANKQLRNYMKQHNVPYWRLAVAFGVTEQTIIRWLRIELTDAQREVFISKVNQIIKAQED